MDVDPPDLAGMYRETRERLAGLVAGLDEAQLGIPVPACPGWSVADVIGHLAAIPEDALAGRLTGPPGEAETAVQVDRFRGRPMTQTLAGWAGSAPRFEETVAAFGIWPAVIDVASHEQDIRGAVGQPGWPLWTGPATRPRSWITWWSSGPPRRTSSNSCRGWRVPGRHIAVTARLPG